MIKPKLKQNHQNITIGDCSKKHNNIVKKSYLKIYYPETEVEIELTNQRMKNKLKVSNYFKNANSTVKQNPNYIGNNPMTMRYDQATNNT